MYASNSNLYREPIPISSQFAEVLESDIQDYVENLRQLDTPEIAEGLQSSRNRMLSENIIQQSQTVQGLGSMVAVDGGNNVLNIGLGTQCFVVSVLYSLRQNYDVRISMERLAFEEEEATALMYGVRNAMEVRDIYDANERESFCIVDNSWVSLLENVNRVLVNYRRNSSDNDQQILLRFLRPMLSKNGHFISILQNSRNIAISKGGVSRFYCDRYGKNLILLDKVFLLGVLQAGEYTKPIPLSESGLGKLNVHTDSIFESQNAIKEIYNATFTSTGDVKCICSTYYKPHAWSPVKRIEFNQELLSNGHRLFHQMLATVKDSMIVPTIYEPLEQFLVDQVVKRHTGRLPNLYQTVGVANIQDFNSNLATQLVRRFRT
ncbi:MAG: hypothetical protein GPI92_06525 [Microcystis aeruginosa K13-06]|jgi:hypothetical protein|uniref:hypothetical protein n=1 Tax=Microcystis sp. TaxID=1127 RepID=UPI0022BBFB05|nr:hypothetical protein [Microcystis sp. LE17-20D]MCE2721544.1 hypothetical protein [Anabaena sp. 49628_E55]MCZ8066981.1 hypothetical protein [Microcystis sp. LE17-20D]MCZ8274819.1 hypothetical protein [Microcystis sp. LE19-4.1E]NCR75254.1 hypothetical protein [Microcystis aeruginosa K13-06]